MSAIFYMKESFPGNHAMDWKRVGLSDSMRQSLCGDMYDG